MGFMSLVAVYTPIKVCGADEKETFYAKLDSVLVPETPTALSF